MFDDGVSTAVPEPTSLLLLGYDGLGLIDRDGGAESRLTTTPVFEGDPSRSSGRLRSHARPHRLEKGAGLEPWPQSPASGLVIRFSRQRGSTLTQPYMPSAKWTFTAQMTR